MPRSRNKYLFQDYPADEVFSRKLREIEDNFVSVDGNGNIKITGDVICKSVKQDPNSTYLGEVKFSAPSQQQNNYILRYDDEFKILRWVSEWNIAAMAKLTTDKNRTIPAGYAQYVPCQYEISAGNYVEIGDTAIFEIG